MAVSVMRRQMVRTAAPEGADLDSRRIKMNEHNTIAERLLTWLDVERLLKQRTTLWARLPMSLAGYGLFCQWYGDSLQA